MIPGQEQDPEYTRGYQQAVQDVLAELRPGEVYVGLNLIRSLRATYGLPVSS